MEREIDGNYGGDNEVEGYIVVYDSEYKFEDIYYIEV